MNWRDMLDPSITSRDLDRLAEKLSLTPDQKAAARDLLEGFQAQYQDMATTLREAFDAARQEFQETRDPNVWRDVQKIAEKAQGKIKSMEAAFFTDLKSVLDAAQTEKLPEFERSRKREKSLAQGFLSGETVDVVRLAEDVKLSPESRATIEPVLKQYELEIEKPLAERDELYQSGMSQGMQLFQTGQLDKMADMFNKARDAGMKVRDINRKYARQVEGLLPEGERAAFSAEFLERSFPRVYRASYATSAINTAKNLKDLTPEQKTEIEAIAETYRRESAPINEKWTAAIEQSEKTRTIMQMFAGGGTSEEIQNAQKARRELDDNTLDKLRAVLTESQAAKLPEKQTTDWRRSFRDGGGN